MEYIKSFKHYYHSKNNDICTCPTYYILTWHMEDCKSLKSIKEQKESIWRVQNYIEILSQKTARKV